MPFRLIRRLGCFTGLLFILVVGLVLVVLLFAVIAPWSFHIGGRWTPMSWWGYGTLHTESGDYPIFIYFYPNPRSTSRLRLNGQRPSIGLRGNGWLCSAQGVTQRLDVTGDIYNTYVNTEGSKMSLRLLDARKYLQLSTPTNRRYADFTGAWQGSQLVMKETYGWEQNFRHDPNHRNDRASITFNWSSYFDFKNVCNSTVIPLQSQIAPPPN
jgi:hypothetical protein